MDWNLAGSICTVLGFAATCAVGIVSFVRARRNRKSITAPSKQPQLLANPEETNDKDKEPVEYVAKVKKGHPAASDIREDLILVLILSAKVKDQTVTIDEIASFMNRKPLEARIMAQDLHMQGLGEYFLSSDYEQHEYFRIGSDGVRLLVSIDRLPDPETSEEGRIRESRIIGMRHRPRY